MIALVGGITRRYIKEIHLIEENNIELEKQTTKLIDEN